MMPNLNDIMMAVNQLKSNPMAILGPKFNIPPGMNSPEDIIQHLLNSGQVTQNQVNMAMQMRNNPMFRGLFK